MAKTEVLQCQKCGLPKHTSDCLEACIKDLDRLRQENRVLKMSLEMQADALRKTGLYK